MLSTVLDWGSVIGLLAVLIAIAVPLLIEWGKRPKLRIELGADSNQRHRDAAFRIAHVNVVNEPIGGVWGKLLTRHTAVACSVRIVLRSRSDDEQVEVSGKWSATPEPLFPFVHEAEYHEIPDVQRIGAASRHDVQPGGSGEPVAIAIKHDGEHDGYACGVELYFDVVEPPLHRPELRLPDTDYDVLVAATSGQATADEVFRLENRGTRYTGLNLTEFRND